ncbi:translocon-associated protein subunit delta [Folsomia candida]|uniref:translocon-associated protein subunit delta n=1 Tax=Folsomia candida TaxID=158441 RepID=UPI000B9050CF|nr:translocon-associated protein subunit delta [Folsomia candida]
MSPLVTLVLLGVVSVTTATTCKLTSPTSYTTRDASVLTSIAYISNFQLSCQPSLAGKNVYAVEDSTGVVVPLGIGADGSYQISIVKEVSTQTKGDHTFSIHSDEGLSQIKKKQPAVALATVVLNHPGAWSGPWLNSEHLAAILGVLVGYAAISGKGKLLS